MNDRTEDISSQPVGPRPINPEKMPPDPNEFRSMVEPQRSPKQNPAQERPLGPMELAQQSAIAPRGSWQEMQSQIAQSDAHLTEIQKKIQQYPHAKLKRQHGDVLHSKLEQANEHLQKMNTKLGVPQSKGKAQVAREGPLSRFLGFINEGQNHLMAAKARLEEMGKNTHEINPANLLSVQIQAAQAQQNLEYASTMLGAFIQNLKQILNTQL
ncbi:MAG: hypothetical protein AAGF04_02700 [Chlamydiota bacterium]